MSKKNQTDPENIFDDIEEIEEEEAQEEQELLDDPFTQVTILLEERDEYKDKWMRALAEGENLRKRAARDRQDAELYGGTKLARDLLSVYDNLDRALSVIDDELRAKNASLVEGLELTQRELVNVFEKHKIRLINPEIGERFDPNLHQAMFEAPVAGQPAGTIIQVMAPGFEIGERLLRAANVGVSSGG